MPAILRHFAEYAAAAQGAALPEAVQHAARRCIVDWFAAVLPGGTLPPATLLIAALAEDIGQGGAMLFPSGRRASTRTAALVNGAASHTIEFDDIFRDAIYHPGTPVISAALALAQSRRASGAAFLRAIVAGYEISTRIGVAVNPAHYRYWHTTGTVGTFGAAAAAAVILGLNAEQALHALANAGTLAAGLQQAFRADAMSKPLHSGHAAECGVMVALAAAHGVTGAPDILEGPRGFGAAMSDKPDWEAATAALGTRFNILAMTQKNHAACGHAHAAIDAVIALREQHRLAPAAIERIAIATYGAALEVTGNFDPRTEFEAKFSLPYCAAVALATGSARMAAFAPERRADPSIRDLMARIELAVDPQ
ncbi:MAG: MmgE/PrpD family protein, partial [Alphaproteobacteria bacterium]|nr:MmgE/PrpD family protein [Alphaproteobacteria bacterium]